MKALRRVLAVAHDAGGARALIPVTRALAHGVVRVTAVVAGPAASFWQRECPSVRAESVPDTVTVDEATTRLQLFDADVLLSACGLYNRIEHTFRVAAREIGLPSVAVLDSWLNYGERFIRGTGAQAVQCHPDVVCVMDHRSRRGMMAAGLKPTQVAVTGAPNLEHSLRSFRSARRARVALRAVAGIQPGDFVITFFSEPFLTGPDARFEGPGALVGPAGDSLYGYTADQTLTAVLDNLVDAARRVGRRCTVVIKPHPAEWAAPLREIAASRTQPELRVCVVSAEDPAAEWLAVADAAIGMMSIALLEAAIAGLPTVSVQVGLIETGMPDPCLANALGYSRAVYDRATLRRTMFALLDERVRSRRRRPAMLPVQGATRRVVRIVQREARR